MLHPSVARGVARPQAASWDTPAVKGRPCWSVADEDHLRGGVDVVRVEREGVVGVEGPASSVGSLRSGSMSAAVLRTRPVRPGQKSSATGLGRRGGRPPAHSQPHAKGRWEGSVATSQDVPRSAAVEVRVSLASNEGSSSCGQADPESSLGRAENLAVGPGMRSCPRSASSASASSRQPARPRVPHRSVPHSRRLRRRRPPTQRAPLPRVRTSTATSSSSTA